MSRVPDAPGYLVAMAGQATMPFYLVSITIGGVARYITTGSDYYWDSKLWVHDSLTVKSVNEDAASIVFPNEDFMWTSIILNDKIRDSRVKIYMLYGSADYTGVQLPLLFDGVVDEQILPDDGTAIINCVTDSSIRAVAPSITLARFLGVNCMPAGTIINWDNKTLKIGYTDG